MPLRPSCAIPFVRFAALAGALAAVAGCSLGAGGIGISPGHPLSGQARRVRVSVPPTAPIARELDKTVATPYFIEPGDELLVEPASFDSPLRFPTDQAVLSDGTIDLGKYGRVIVAGFTIEQIEEVVESIVRQREQEKLEPADLAVNVRLIDPQSKVYYVLGEVNAPGSYNLIGRETVLGAILTAGRRTNLGWFARSGTPQSQTRRGCRRTPARR
jgi:polysaccharide export outer membrane protein